MRHSDLKPNRLDVFGSSMLNKLPSESRRRRKRQASKKRRSLVRAEGRTATLAIER